MCEKVISYKPFLFQSISEIEPNLFIALCSTPLLSNEHKVENKILEDFALDN